VTAELITFVFQFMLIVMSLYGLKMKPLGGGELGGGFVGGGSLGGGVVVPPPEQLPSTVHGWPLPAAPLLVDGLLPEVHQFAL
jgi:hypothetical protein